MSSINTNEQPLTVYSEIHIKVHELEVLLAKQMNQSTIQKECEALEHAHDHLVHQVAEWIRTAEKRSKM